MPLEAKGECGFCATLNQCVTCPSTLRCRGPAGRHEALHLNSTVAQNSSHSCAPECSATNLACTGYNLWVNMTRPEGTFNLLTLHPHTKDGPVLSVWKSGLACVTNQSSFFHEPFIKVSPFLLPKSLSAEVASQITICYAALPC